jgi:LmbE family N-acetylglucosaminyl deacetylase
MAAERKTVLAIGAHPDDIEFMMAGTLIMLGQAGYELHYMNCASGSCGTADLSREKIVKIRKRESQKAAKFIEAVYHPPLADDIEIFYEKSLLAKLGAVVRKVNPSIMLIPSPEDYMEDHSITSRLAVTAAFCRGMRNFVTVPKAAPVTDEVVLYHALPYGLSDGMRKKIFPGEYVDISSVIDNKREMLEIHRSQKDWLDTSQGVDSYLMAMVEMSREVGKMSRKFIYAEGWRRHSNLGFAIKGTDPLADALKRKVKMNPKYEKELKLPLKRNP